MITVIYRTLFFYFFIFLIYRLMGKREIGQLSIIDLVVSMLIAELVAISIEKHDETLLYTVIPISILVILEMLISYISLKSSTFRAFIEGKPSLIINNGIINYKEMKKQRYTLDNLLLELRNNGYKSLEEIEYAVLENNGKLSIFKKKLFNKGILPYPLILDGIIVKDNFKYTSISIEDLKIYLLNNNILISDIFYCFYKNNKYYIINKSDVKSD